QGEFSSVRPILERRCMVCHACYDAPCQLNLQSYEGADRGGSNQPVYHPGRVRSIKPTRMFQDVTTTEGWRDRFQFFPVLSHSRAPADSILHHFVAWH